MFYIFKSKLHIAALCVLLITVIFIIHQMLSSVGEPAVSTDTTFRFEQYQTLSQVKPQSLSLEQDMPSSTKLEKFLVEKLVHLDLKGAPPLISYLERLFPLLKRLGATGILVEYEDMFPYYDTLKNIPAYNAYNQSEIKEMLQHAENSGLKVIPLIQTFGHLEFVLKLEEYRDLREIDMYPQVICPTHSHTQPFLFKMIDQIMAAHPGITHIHIGSDEVYYLGRCSRCNHMMDEKVWTKQQLFLSHVHNVTSYIKKRYPNVRPIMWDDEFRGLDEDIIMESEVNKLVDIMVWKYTPNVGEFITDDILEKYSKLFDGIWIGTAFKGASGPSSMVTDVRYHLENHQSWVKVLAKWKERLNVKGIALTGWQRYDHFAVLCELLPVAIPSLTVCLRYLDGHTVDDNTMSQMLECDFPFAWSPNSLFSLRPANNCGYPGSALYQLVNSLYVTLEDISKQNRATAQGWFTWHQTIHNFSSPAHVEESTSLVDSYKIQLQFLEGRLRTELLTIYDSHTAEEWISTFVLPAATKVAAAGEARDRLLAQRTWPRRPLDREVSDKNILQGICRGTGSLECSLLGV